MKVLKRGFWVAAIFGGGLWIGSMITSNADGLIQPNQPGSIDDPIVTKSYVEQSVQQLVKQEFSKQTVNTDEITTMINNFKKEVEEAGKKAVASLNVVELKSGQILYAGTGTEFIVRNGKAIAFSNDGNGIPDLTAGKDIPNGAIVDNNHLLLFPREGRGIKPDPATTGTLYIMVRGNYLHVNEDGSQVTP